MASRDYLKHVVSTSEPTNSALGDEYYSPSSNKLFKRLAVNGTAVSFVPLLLNPSPDSTPFVVTSEGKVGIGTNAPEGSLHIKRQDTISFTETHTDFIIENPGLGNARLFLKTLANNRNWEFFADDSDGTFGIYDGVGAARRFTIMPDGNIGIGVSSPIAKLDVYAASGYVDARVRSGSNQTYIAADGTAAYFGTYSNIPIVLSTNNINRGGISNAGVWSLGAPAGSESLRVTPTASAVNYVEIFGGTAGVGGVAIKSGGSDANITTYYSTKGNGGHIFQSNSTVNQFVVAHTASAVNYLQVTGSGTGAGISLSAQGTDTNINIVLTPKGTGTVNATTFVGALTGNASTATNVSGTVAIANGGTGATTAATARTNLGATTLGNNLFTVTNVAAIAFPRINADNTVSTLDAATFRTAIGAGTSSTTGTVTSVGGTGTVSGLTLSGTVTTTGNLTLGGTLAVTATNFASQTANTALAAPDGANGVPTFRALTLLDLPDAWIKRAVKAATTANITLSAPQTIDAISVIAGDRVLVKNQTTASQNGIYIVQAAAWTRAPDADTSSEIAGANVSIDQGTTNGGTVWDTDFKSTDTLGTTSMVWYRRVDTAFALTSGSTVVDGYIRYSGTTNTAGQFNGGTTTPNGTTRLNYSGYFYPSFINLTGSGDTATAATHYFVETGTDGFVRPKTIANVRTEIVTSAAVIAGLGATPVYTTTAQTVAGVKTFSSNISVPSAGVTTGSATAGINLNGTSGTYLFGTTGDGASSTLANVKLASWWGIGFSPSITGQAVPQWQNAAWIDVRSGAISSRNEVTAYSSDIRLKTNFINIQSPLEKVMSIGGYEFDWLMDKCRTLGFQPNNVHEHGVKAQEIQQVVPDAVTIAPFDDNGEKQSKSGENYLTVKYEKLVPLLIEAIKELKLEIDALKAQR